MAKQTISWVDRVENSGATADGKLSAAQANEIKDVVNDNFTENYDAIERLQAKGTDIASATTTDIGAATGDFVHVTGTTTITGLGTITAGRKRIVRFDGILILTHNATSLILPTSSNITTAANDVATFVSEGSGNWRCVEYTRASGASLAGASASFGGLTGVPTDNAALVTKFAAYVDKEDFTSVTFATPLNLDCANKQNPLFKVPSVNTDFTLNMTNVKSGANGLIKLFITTASAVTVTFDSDFTNESQNTVLAPFTFPAGTGKEYFMSFIVDGTTIEWVIIDGRLNIAAGADNNIIVFNATSGNWEAVAVSGDLTNILGAFTVADNAITFAKFQQMAANTVLGNPNGVTADAEEMTTVQMFVTDPTVVTALNTEAGWAGGVKTGITGLEAGQFCAGFNLTDTDYYYEYSCQVNGTGIRKLATKGVKYDTLAVKTPVANKSANYTSTVNDHELNFTSSATLTLHSALSSDGQELVYGTTGAGVTVTIVGTVNGSTPSALSTQYSFQRIKSVNGIWVNR